MEPVFRFRLDPGRAQRIVAGLLFLASGRGLAVPIVAHGVSNTLAFVLIYFGRYPGLE